MKKALVKTDFNFPRQKSVYHGKVRDVYNINDEVLVMVATDRISAFDVILPEGIPYKGQMLNQIAAKFLDATTDICPNWKLATPDPMVTVGVQCQGFPVEMIVRGYLCGSAWRAYKSGVREICGVKLPEGMRENQRFPEPIITPTTKAEIGDHDENISFEQSIDHLEKYFPGRGEELAAKLRDNTIALYKKCAEYALSKGIIIADTKFEFGLNEQGEVVLADEMLTPDSSRFWPLEGYEAGKSQPSYDKQFVRDWLKANPDNDLLLPEEVVKKTVDKYKEAFALLTGKEFNI